MFPKNENEFIKFVEDINSELQKRDVPIHYRPLHALREAALRLRTNINVARRCMPLPGDYSGDSLSGHIEAWYELTYGNRLNMGLSPGSVAILIRGDVWKVRLPLTYGTFEFYCDPFEEHEGAFPPESRRANALLCIEDFTPELSSRLSGEERREIARFFALALQATRWLLDVQSAPYIPEARANLEMAVANLFLSRPIYGESKWASLQFTEKLFKCFLTLKEIPFEKSGKKGHDLALLASLSAKGGLRAIKPEFINDIQCPADVRYGDVAVDLSEAIRAHHSSLLVCSIVCSNLKSTIGG